MAEARVSVDLDEFNCSICLDLLADPVSVPCGHNFCKSCINRQWDEEVLNRVYSCPLCKQHFSPRPILGRNIMLAEMVEKLKKTRVSERTLAGPEDVECDVCIGNKHKAVKSCLVCVASYCQVHFEMHNELNPENTHKVIESRYSLKDRICSVHKKPKDVICCHEEELYCPECVVKSCAYHSTTTVTNKRQEEQFQIKNIQTDVLQRTQAVENSIKDLKKAVNTIKTSAKTTLDQTEKMFAELIRSAERKRSEIRKIIKATEEAEVHRAEKILHGLKQEVTELKERDKKLVQLSNLEDDFLFIKTSKSLFNLSTFSDAPKFTVNLTPFKEIQNSVSELEIKCKEFCMSGLSPGSTAAVNRCHMIQASVPILREDFHQRLWVSDDSSVKLFGKIEKVHECIPEWTEVKHVTQPHPAFRHATHSYLQVRVDAPDSPQAGVIEVQVFVPSKNLRIPLSVKSTDTAATLIKKCLEQRPDLGETLNLAYNGKPVSPCKILGELGVKSGAMFITYQRCIG